MTTFQDCSVGIGTESTYGTGVTPVRFLEYVDESIDFNKKVVQGVGLRVGSRVARSARRVVTTADAGGDLSMECISKGMGLVWQWCMGTGTSTLVSGSTYQQLFTLGDTLPSMTLQKGLPRVDGTVGADTYLGATVDTFEVDCPNGDLVTLKMTVDAKDVNTATAYATPSYAASASLFSFKDGTISTGTLTAPTSTALASAATPLAQVRNFNLKVNNNVNGDRYNFGASGRKAKPTTGMRALTGSMEVEYESATFRDAVIADTPMSIVLTFTNSTALSTGFETLQIVLPELKLNGKMPASNAGDLIRMPLEFDVLDNLTAAQPMWVVTRTADTAL